MPEYKPEPEAPAADPSGHTITIESTGQHAPAEVKVGQNTPAAEAPQEQAPEAERPSWLPEKFKTPEDMARAYAELESMKGKPKAKPGLTVEKPAEAPAAEAPAAAAKLDLASALSEHFADGVSDETYSKLEAAGMSRADVDGYVAGQEALLNNVKTTVSAEVGGMEALESMMTWAEENFTAEEMAAYNRIADTRDIAQAKMAVNYLKGKYEAANGKAPAVRVAGENRPDTGSTIKPYASRQEMMADMAKPAYRGPRRDPAFIAQVEARIRAGMGR